MTKQDAIMLTRRILRARRELAGTVGMIAPDNSIAPGAAQNLTHLAENVAVLRAWLDANRSVTWDDLVEATGLKIED